MADKSKPETEHQPDPVFVKMDQLLAQMQHDVMEMRQALMTLAQIPPAVMADNSRKVRKSELVTRVVQGLMSGRWHLRDGDVYGIVRQPGVPREGDG